MSPGKSQIHKDSKESFFGSRTRSVGSPHETRARASRRYSDAIPSQLQNETEEKKETIMNEAINCIFNQLPEDIRKLDALRIELAKLDDKCFSNDDWLEQLDKDGNVATSNPIAAKYKFAFESARKGFPPSDVQSTKKESPTPPPSSSLDNGMKILASVCARHLLGPNGEPLESSKEHICPKSYTFHNSIKLLPWGTVTTNDELNKLIDDLREIFIELSQHFVNIKLGLRLMFPRTEANEKSNLSLTVLKNLLPLASLKYLNIFKSIPKERAKVIESICMYPHFGESRRMLFEFDRKTCLQVQTVVQNLISQCNRLYDSLLKNIDMVVKAKKQCNQQKRSKSPNSIQSSPSNSLYS